MKKVCSNDLGQKVVRCMECGRRTSVPEDDDENECILCSNCEDDNYAESLSLEDVLQEDDGGGNDEANWDDHDVEWDDG